MTFLEYAKHYRYYMIILLAATCGLRRGEAIALRWEDVDLAKGTLTVRQSYTRGEKGQMFQEPKTKAGIRTLAMPQVTIEAMKRQKVLQAEDKLATGGKYQDHGLISQTKRGLLIKLRRGRTHVRELYDTRRNHTNKRSVHGFLKVFTERKR